MHTLNAFPGRPKAHLKRPLDALLVNLLPVLVHEHLKPLPELEVHPRAHDDAGSEYDASAVDRVFAAELGSHKGRIRVA